MMLFNFAASGSKHFLCPLKKYKKILLSTIKTKVRNKYSTYNKESCVPRNGPWNVLFFGTDEFSVESLKTLHNKYESKVLQRLEVVVTDRGKDNPVAKYAKQKGIVVNKWPLEISISNFHIGIVVSFGHLIPSSVIDSFPLGMLNVHGSLLPRWRGAAPIIHSLMNGDQQTGVTIMKIMPKRFDIGKIVLQREIDIAKNDMLPELYTRLAKLGADLLGKTFDNLLELLESATPQDSANATYAPKITRQMCVINWNEMSAKNVYDLYRALLGVYPLIARFQDRTIKLHYIGNIEESIATKLDGETPGTVIYSKKRNALIVKCKGETWISVKKIVISGKCPTNAIDFYNGFIAGKNKRKTLFS